MHGGEIVVSGWLEDLLTAKANKSGSRTLAYLREEERIEIPEKRRTADRGKIKIRGANKFNIKNLNIDVPLAKFVVVSGVSGSGKSTFLYEILHRNLLARFDKRYRSAKTYNAAEFSGTEYLGRSILIDQSPIGRTPRSNPATYTGAWTHIRDMFAMSEEARARAWGPGRFSFNVKGGRCETCEGQGQIKIEMQFMSDIWVTCEVCKGSRYTQKTLEVQYRAKNISDVLNLSVTEALDFFHSHPVIINKLDTLQRVGLDYIDLGQPATTLSGGEAQRVKLASELSRRATGKTFYILDEPTTGLHFADLEKLLKVLRTLVDRGNTVVVIEHNLDVVKNADWIIDLGPEGGDNGGYIVGVGTPEQIAHNKKSYTGQFLKKVL